MRVGERNIALNVVSRNWVEKIIIIIKKKNENLIRDEGKKNDKPTFSR